MMRLVWNECEFTREVDIYGTKAQARFRLLHELFTEAHSGKRQFEIRVVPDKEFGFVHGKAGVIRYDGRPPTAFMGSANDSENAWKQNYELVWEDSSDEAVSWVQDEFDALWEKGFSITEFIVKQLGRLGTRTVIEHIEDWRAKSEPSSLLGESPTCSQLFGFWDHQKYFINLAFKEHRRYGTLENRGARFLLADGVGLGKTLQLGAIAKLIGAHENLPILILAPKPLVTQWQGELVEKLATPSAVWESDGSKHGGWRTELDEYHPADPEKIASCPRRIGIISTSIITSASNSSRNQKLSEDLLKKRFSCVIWDEAHKIRRRNLQESNVFKSADKNTLYQWAERVAARTKTFLLATATPIQLHPIELWDLLHVLSIQNPQVLGSDFSKWQDATHSEIFDIISGKEEVGELYDRWNFLRNPLPLPAGDNPEQHVFFSVRQALGLDEVDDEAEVGALGALPLDIHDDLAEVDVRELNPFTLRIIKRSRSKLEEQGKLVKIEMVSMADDLPIPCTHHMERALELSDEFAVLLSSRVKASGFIKTLLQRRVSSSLNAGIKTASNMIVGKEPEDEASEEDFMSEQELLYPLTKEELELLTSLKEHLERQLGTEGDLKFARVADILDSEFEGQSWLEIGTLIFSQFYDSAYALAEYLSERHSMEIGLYSSSSSSKLFERGDVKTINRELLKEKVTLGRLKLLIGTDAASTGLNLQQLGGLINLDLPWNPTVLEQRKGRVQRGTIGKRIPFYNMRFDQGAEARLFDVLSGRIEEITNVFGAVPDFIVDEWVKEKLKGRELTKEEIILRVEERKTNPFQVKETSEFLLEDWDATAEVLNENVQLEEFRKPW